MNLISLIISVFFILWLIVTIINSSKKGGEILSSYLGVWYLTVPKWNFFSPHPGEYDYYLLYRGRRGDGSLTPWQKINHLEYRSSRFSWLWNPDILRHKALFDAVQRIMVAASEDNPDDTGDYDEGLRAIDVRDIKITLPYLTFLNCVTQQSHSPFVEEVEFVIMRRSRLKNANEPILTSNYHSVKNDN